MVMRYNLTRKKTKRNTDQANNKIKSWFIDSQYEHSRYIVGVERVQHMDCVEHVEHSLKYMQYVYMLFMYVQRDMKFECFYRGAAHGTVDAVCTVPDFSHQMLCFR